MIINSFLISSQKLSKNNHVNFLYKVIGKFYLYLNNKDDAIKIYENRSHITLLIGHVENLHLDYSRNNIFAVIHKNLTEKTLYEMEGKFNIIRLDKKNGDLLVYSSTKQSFDVYYTISDDIVVTNNIYNYKLIPNLEVKPNSLYENFYLSYDFFPFNETHVDNVKILPFDKLVKINSKSIEFIPLKNISGKIEKLPKQSFKNLHGLFEQYFNSILPKDKSTPIAVLMGGIDSMFVAKFISDLGYQVDCFTFFHKNQELNQKNIDKFVKEANVNHYWVPIDEKNVYSELREYSKYGNPISFAIYNIITGIAAQFLRAKGYSYCFTGDGADENFYGYPSVYKRIIAIDKLNKYLPYFIRAIGYKLLSLSLINLFFRSIVSVPRRLLNSSLQNFFTRNFLSYKVLDEFEYSSTIRCYRNPSFSNIEILNLICPTNKNILSLGYAGRSASSTNKKRNQYIYLKYGLNTLSPFYNRSIINFAKNIKDSLKISSAHNLGKDFFLKYLSSYAILSDDIIYQKKQSPIVSKFHYSLKNYLSFLKVNYKYLKRDAFERKLKFDISVGLSDRIFKSYFQYNYFFNLYTYFNFFR